MVSHSSHPSWLLTCLTYRGSSLISPIMTPQLSHPPWLICHLTHHGSSLISQIMASSDMTLKDCWSWYLVFFCCSYESCRILLLSSQTVVIYLLKCRYMKMAPCTLAILPYT